MAAVELSESTVSQIQHWTEVGYWKHQIPPWLLPYLDMGFSQNHKFLNLLYNQEHLLLQSPQSNLALCRWPDKTDSSSPMKKQQAHCYLHFTYKIVYFRCLIWLAVSTRWRRLASSSMEEIRHLNWNKTGAKQCCVYLERDRDKRHWIRERQTSLCLVRTLLFWILKEERKNWMND